MLIICRWSLIAGRIPGRTDNEIKNYWNTHLSKKLISQGIDPRTHKPLTNSTTVSTNYDHQLINMVTSVSPSATTAQKNDHNNASNNLPVVNGSGSATATSTDNISGIGLVEHHESDGSDIPPQLFHNYVQDHHNDDQFQVMIDNVTLERGIGNNSFLNLSNNNGDDHTKDQFDDEMNYNSCGGEDVFSTFLNSLIDEEDHVFINSGRHMVQHSHHNQLMQANNDQQILTDISVDPLGHESESSFRYINGNTGTNYIDDKYWGINETTLMSASAGNAVLEPHDDLRSINFKKS